MNRSTTSNLSITTLGSFRVRSDNEDLEIPSGLPSLAIKFVVASGGRSHTEAVIDALWPQATVEEGRKGIRNVLSRLARTASTVLVRDGEALRIADRVSVDAVAFQVAADRVLMDAGRPGAAEGARFALARYDGEFLPDDRYCDWAEGPRARLRRRQLALIDVLVADARRRGEALEAAALLELAIEIDPDDEVRYFDLAELLIAAGRRGRAAAFMAEARQVLHQHGLLPGGPWMRLQRQLHDDRRVPVGGG